MFRDGTWAGFWTAEPLLDDPVNNVHDLHLSFRDGQVSGSGVDLVGDFTLSGQYDDAGAVHLVKAYVGRHTVDYEGQRDEQGCLAGRWTIPDTVAGYFLWVPPGVDDPSALVEAWYRRVQGVVAQPARPPRRVARQGCLSAVVLVLVALALVGAWLAPGR